ncbi:hypothetical protein, partial [Roseibium sp.]|uniref:hypothetical protein n=1 Tax=Roseibium sp. TaxID=1936156 RepID=UPI0035185F27
MSITDIESRSETTYRTVPSVGPSTLVPSISHLNEGELPETAFGQFLIDRGAEISGEPTMDGHWHVVPLMVDGRQVDAQYRALDPQTPGGDFTGELRTADGKVLGLWVGREDGLTVEEQLHARDVSGQELEERELVGRADMDRPV